MDVASQPRQWTIAVDLAVNLDTPGQYGRLGAEDKMGRLRQMQSQTTNSPVTIVAQQIVPEKQDGKTVYSLKRYAIHDGKIDDLTPPAGVPSKGMGKDLTDLLKIAGQQYPSAKLGLVTNSHGDGDNGLIGDNGKVSLPKLQGAIKDGLQGSGHQKLDLVNFDACLMAQLGVLDKMAPVAKQLVASASPENAGQDSSVDGQNLNAWLGDLTKNPQMDGRQLAKDIIRQADRGANSDGTISGTDTLAHFDLEHSYDGLKKNVDEFTKGLAAAAQGDPLAKEAIKAAIAKAPESQARSFAAGFDALNDQGYASQLRGEKRDLGSFAKSINGFVKDGLIPDPDGSLARSSSALSGNLAAEFHGPKTSKGLTAFLPEQDYLDTNGAAKRTTAVGQIEELTDPKSPAGLREINIEPLGDVVKRLQSQMKREPGAQEPLRSIDASMQAVRRSASGNTTDTRALDSAEAALRTSAQQLEHTGAFQRDFKEHQTHINKIFNGERDTQAETGNKNWGKFIDSVK